MKKTDALQLVVISFALMCAYELLQMAPQFLVYLYGWFTEGLKGGGMAEMLIINIIFIAAYAIFAIYGIRYSKRIAEAIAMKTFTGESPTVSLNLKETFFVVFAAIGIYGLVRHTPGLLVDLYSYFKKENNLNEFATPKPGNQEIFLEVFTTCLYFLLLVYAHVFADIISSKLRRDNAGEEEIGNITDTLPH